MSEEHLDDESQDGQCDLYPIAVLLEELKNGDVSCKINALRKIPVVAEALGPDRTRNELIKFLEGVYF